MISLFINQSYLRSCPPTVKVDFSNPNYLNLGLMKILNSMTILFNCAFADLPFSKHKTLYNAKMFFVCANTLMCLLIDLEVYHVSSGTTDLVSVCLLLTLSQKRL